MSQQQHTQEPVAWRDGETGFVGRLKGGPHWQPLYQTLPYDHNPDAAARIAELEKQRDTLLAALEKARNGLSGGLWDYGPGQDEHDKCNHLIAEIDAAIASVKEQA